MADEPPREDGTWHGHAGSPDRPVAEQRGGPLGRPVAVRASMALVLVLIGYRVVLVAASVEGFTRGRFEPPPAGLGSPLLLFLLVPFLIVVRRFIGAGYGWARDIYAVYAAVRVAAIVVAGPWHRHSLVLALLYVASAALLFTPSARRWFGERRSGRA